MTDRTHPDSGRATGGIVEMLQARIAELEAQLEIGAGGVNGPLMGQPQAMPDLSALTERGAVAWAGVDAQGLRDGGASHSANAGEPSEHIKEPYTLAEIKAKIASNDYGAEMLLQHAMLLLDSASLAASAGSEPVAWLVCTEEGDPDMVFLSQHEAQQYLEDDERPTPLYTHPSPPEGMVATDAMIEAGKKMLHNSNGRGAREKVERIFNAMIAAAPPTSSADSRKGE